MSPEDHESGTEPPSVDTTDIAIELAKRAFALRKYEQAVDHYATALELMTKKHGEDAPEMADLYFSYGKALLENAISQAGVLGKEHTEEGAAVDDKASTSGPGAPVLSFSGDIDDTEDVDEGEAEDTAVDLFAQALRDVEEEQAEAEGEEDEAEPEDDFNAAWEVLDLARAIYDKQQDGDDETKLKLADTYIALGDVSLETEKFDQAITDYSTGLSLKTELLPVSSRQIAEAHYKLSMVLDLTSGRLADAIVHSEEALKSVETRLAELRDGLNGQLTSISPEDSIKNKDVKGKGKATGRRLVRDEVVQSMTRGQMEVEIKEMEGLREDLALKVEELKTTPNENHSSAPALAAEALDRELNAPSASSSSSKPVVNDLTAIVKKKKKPEANGGAKRKAEDDGAPSEKKVKTDS